MQNTQPIKINDKFGRLTVLREAPPAFCVRKKENGRTSKHRIKQWLCLCDCGNEKAVAQCHLLRKKHQTFSCGCARKGPKSVIWRGYKEISGHLWGSTKTNAKKRNLDFTITIEEMWDLFIKQGKICALSGLPLKFDTSTNSKDGNASIDRIDSNKGYIIDNVQWVDKRINEMKWNLGEEEFIEFCHLVAVNN
jgi:hypothetical protein